MGRGIFNTILIGFTLSLTGCGAGIVALVVGLSSGGGGSGTGSAAVVSALGVSHARSSPAAVNFLLTDPESRPTDVDVTYSMQAAGGRSQAQDEKVIVRLKGQKSSPLGSSNSYSWDFGTALGQGLVRGVRVRAAIPDGSSASVTDLSMGNDPPVVTNLLVPTGKVAGIVNVEFTVSDSSDDLVKILVEYRPAGSTYESDWEEARPKGASKLEGVQARSTGTVLDFFWDAKTQLGNTEAAVEIRVTADDGLATSTVSSAPASLIVNNNQRPVATISAEEFASNPDRRRGIPVPFLVEDDDGDEVRMVFQWRLAGQKFPDLPADRAGIEEILADSVKRRELHVASEFPARFEGRLALSGPQDAPGETKVRLPEVASTASPLLARGLAGLELEILRSSQVPRPWGRSSDLSGPVGAVPLGDGIRGLVLDRAGAGAFRLRELDLGSGKVVRTIVPSSEGDPAALCLEPGGTHAWVAANLAGTARVSRVDLETGEVALLADAGPGPVRGLAMLGSGVALVTAGDSLVRVTSGGPGGAQGAVVLRGLKTPWGIAVDPHDPSKAYLAERDGGDPGAPGRVLVLDLSTLARRPLSVTGATLGRPGVLALDPTGKRLLVVTGAGGEGARALVEVDLAAGAKGESAVLIPSLPGEVGGMVAGPDMLLALALPASNDLLLGGGVEQRRRIEAYTPKGTEATVDAPFDPPLRGFEPWRIPARVVPLEASPDGRRGTFVWDSSDAPQGGGVVLRAVPYDLEKGISNETGVPRQFQGIFPETPVLLGDADSIHTPQTVALEDIDGDGRRDLIAADLGGLSVFLQGDPGKFPAKASRKLKGPLGPRSVVAADLDGDGFPDLAAPDSLGSGVAVFFGKDGGPTGDQPDLELKAPREPRQVAAADLDRDGFLDLVVTSAVESKVMIFRQTAPRTFEAGADGVLGGAGVIQSPMAVAVGDLNGDGRPDIASANARGNDLAVFFQSAQGGFAGSPDLRFSSPQTLEPEALAAVDLDGDGDLDLIAACQDSGAIAVFHQEGAPGHFLSEPVVLGELQEPRSLAAADLDGDGRLDLAGADQGSGELAVFFQGSAGAFSLTPDLRLGGLQTPLGIAVADIDGDGRADLAAADALENRLALFLQANARNFPDSPDLVLGSIQTVTSPVGVAPADLNGDGLLDLVVAGEGTIFSLDDSLSVFFQKSPGVFAEEPDHRIVMGFNKLPWSLIVVDLDGDGAVDLVTGNSGPGTVSVYFQAVPGIFPQRPDVELALRGPALTMVSVADLDADGDLDLAVSTNSDLQIFLQEGDRRFLKVDRPMTFRRSADVYDLAVADLDGDGSLDLAALTPFGPDLIFLFLQKVDGSFSSSPDLSFGSAQSPPNSDDLAASDLDGDGFQDLITRGPTSGLLLFFQEEGKGFPDAQNVSLDDSGSGTFDSNGGWAGDLDGDSRLDLVSGNQGSSTLTIFYQRTPRGFGSTRVGTSGVIPDRILTGVNCINPVLTIDLDVDGDPDLAAMDYYDGSLKIYFGNH